MTTPALNAIDVHTHVVPANISHEPARDRLWPSVQRKDHDQAAVVIDGKRFRLIDSRCWDAARRLSDMDAEGVAIQVLSPMPELLSHWLAADDAAYLSDIVNETIAAMVAFSPARFAGLGMIAAQDPRKAAPALAKVAALGLSGIEIGTHINGVALGHRSLWPIYEAAEANNLALFVHPLRPCGLERIGEPVDLAVAASFSLEISMAALSLIGGGVLKSFPRLRVLLSHGGGALTSVLGRVDMIRSQVPALNKALHEEDVWSIARRFWYDSNVYDADTLAFVAKKIGRDRIAVGSDYPFLIRQAHPGAFVESALPGSAHSCCASANALLGRTNLHAATR